MTVGMTPLMRQYHEIKSRFPQEIILFQVGDFYEIFYDDAKKASAHLGIVLTSRGTNNGEPIPLCGFPRHTVDAYLIKLIQGGFRVVMCDQITTTDSASAGVAAQSPADKHPVKLIERVVSQVLTPGTLTDPKLLDEKSASYLGAVVATEQAYGLLFVEAMTGTLYATITKSLHKKLLEAELSRFMPNEVIVHRHETQKETEQFLQSIGYITTHAAPTAELKQLTKNWLEALQQPAADLMLRSPALFASTALIYTFLEKHNPAIISQIKRLELYQPDDFLILDAATQRNLELVKNQDGTRNNTLLSILDHAATPMGSRMIKKWILRPLTNKQQIEERFDAVQALLDAPLVCAQLKALLKSIGDIERVAGRIALQRAQAADYLMIMRFLEKLPQLQHILSLLPTQQAHHFLEQHASFFAQLTTMLQRALYAGNEREWLIQEGFHAELDRLRTLVDSGSHAVLALEQEEQKKTGINSLKIRFNNAHGYGIEITKTHAHLIPEHYQRLQTLVNRERFTTPALRELEFDIRRAQLDSTQIEKELFAQVCQEVQPSVPSLTIVAHLMAELDAYLGFAQSAEVHGFVRPIMVPTRDLHIVGGRHPVVEAKIRHKQQGQFIANDTALTENERLWIITGPNMGGKSTFLRQTALMVVMAQAGSFVPSASAHIPLFDRIFTRIGAADNVAQGKSTFWVEMEETALICHEATEKSLVILDEIGRGTSTYDGLAIAQAVLEYMYEHIKARCLFATHYHELVELTSKEGIVAYHAASKKNADGIVLLYAIKPGCAQGSFGIEVAKSAQLPQRVIARAQEILSELSRRESAHASTTQTFMPAQQEANNEQYEKLWHAVQEVDLDLLSPRQAFEFVGNLKTLINE